MAKPAHWACFFNSVNNPLAAAGLPHWQVWTTWYTVTGSYTGLNPFLTFQARALFEWSALEHCVSSDWRLALIGVYGSFNFAWSYPFVGFLTATQGLNTTGIAAEPQCVCVVKRASGRTSVGRSFLPSVCKDHQEGSRLSTAGRAAYANVGQTLITPSTHLGLTFTPGVRFTTDDEILPWQRWSTPEILSYVRRRARYGRTGRGPIFMPPL